jgi:protein phosphatase-4 regulatory subunit 3
VSHQTNTQQDGDEGIKSQSLELILKLCSVDPGDCRPRPDPLQRTLSHCAAARAHLDDFLSHFYEKHISALSVFLGSFVAEEELAKDAALRNSRATTFSHVVEALSDFVKTHNFRLKHCIMQHKIMARVAALCAHPQKHVVLCALRFIKTCIFRCVAPL